MSATMLAGLVKVCRELAGWPDESADQTLDGQRADIRGRNVVVDENLDRGERVVAAAAGDRKALRCQVDAANATTAGKPGLPEIAHQHVGLGGGRQGEGAGEREQRRGGQCSDGALRRTAEARDIGRRASGGGPARRRVALLAHPGRSPGLSVLHSGCTDSFQSLRIICIHCHAALWFAPLDVTGLQGSTADETESYRAVKRLQVLMFSTLEQIFFHP